MSVSCSRVKGERGSAGPIVSQFGVMQVRFRNMHEIVVWCRSKVFYFLSWNIGVDAVSGTVLCLVA